MPRKKDPDDAVAVTAFVGGPYQPGDPPARSGLTGVQFAERIFTKNLKDLPRTTKALVDRIQRAERVRALWVGRLIASYPEGDEKWTARHPTVRSLRSRYSWSAGQTKSAVADAWQALLGQRLLVPESDPNRCRVDPREVHRWGTRLFGTNFRDVLWEYQYPPVLTIAPCADEGGGLAWFVRAFEPMGAMDRRGSCDRGCHAVDRSLLPRCPYSARGSRQNPSRAPAAATTRLATGCAVVRRTD